ncbi:MAG: ribosome biogenesis factor YjgA [Pseudomonadota bacterium]|nr:ribosome biogenesis factor YjgA [Pseudomonadota bacterium]
MSRHRRQDPENAWEDLEERPSKTEQKKAMQRLQALGQQLAELSPAQIKKLPVNEYLIDTLLQLHEITAHEARRRQFQLVGKLLRSENEGVIIAALSNRQSQRKQAQLSRWLERLVEQGDLAVNEFVRQYVAAERHTLRQHVLRLQRAIAQQDPEPQQAEYRQNLVNYIQQVALLSE